MFFLREIMEYKKRSLKWYFRTFTLLIIILSNCSPLRIENDQLTNEQIKVYINFYPENSEIIVDGKNIGQTPLNTYLDIEDTQDFHTIEIQKENYISYVRQFSIPPSKEVTIEGTLSHIITTENIEGQGNYPGWIGNKFFFFNKENSQLTSFNNGLLTPLYNFSIDPYWFIYTEEGIFWSEKKGNKIEVEFYNIETLQTDTIATGWYVADWNETEKAIYLMGYSREADGNLSKEFKLFKIDNENNKLNFDFSQNPKGWLPEEVSISANGNQIMTKTSGFIEIWKYDGNSYIYDHIEEDWLNIKFSPINEAIFFYLDNNSNLIFQNQEQNQTLTIDQNVLLFHWTHDGKNIIYTKDTRESSNSIWIYDLENNQNRIIADPARINGNILNLSLNKNNQKLAYVNRYHFIELLNF